MRKGQSIRRVIAVAIVVVLVLAVEVIFFNARYWITRSSETTTISTFTCGSALHDNGDGTFTISSDASQVADAYIEFNIPNEQVKYVAIDSGAASSEQRVVSAYESVRDANSGEWGKGDAFTYCEGASLSSFQRAPRYDSIAVNAMRVYFTTPGQTVAVGDVRVNARCPFDFNGIRVLAMLALVGFAFAIRPASRLYRIALDTKSRNQRIAFAVYSIVAVALFLWVCTMAGQPKTFTGIQLNTVFGAWFDADQYPLLADALIHGHLNIDLPVDSTLASMENPYDFTARLALWQQNGMQYFWDHAYYQGNYYCYFGVVPALLVFVPYELLTGQWLLTAYGVMVFGVLFVVFASLAIVRVARRFFGDTASVGMVFLVLCAFLLGSNILYLGFLSAFYSIPIAASMAFTMAGLWFWMGARKPDGTLSGWHIAAGSVCMALNFGCRPQFCVSWLLAFPLFWNEIAKERTLLSRKGAGNTMCALLPFAVIIAPLLWYNYARFGSVVNFGSAYNLTSFDMTTTHISFSRFPQLIFLYLFQPASVSAIFPYVGLTDITLSGWSPTEPSLGGLFGIAPFALFAIGCFVFKDALKKRSLWVPCLLLLAIAILVMFVDMYFCGLAWRYFSDFAWCYLAVAGLVAFVIEADHKAIRKVGVGSGHTMLMGIMALSVLVCLFVNGFGLYVPNRWDSLAVHNPASYYAVEVSFEAL